MGDRWEEMTRAFIRDQASRRNLPVDVSSIGRWWNTDSSVEIDIVGLRGKTVVLAGSSKWARSVERGELLRLRRQVEALPDRAEDLRFVLTAREQVRDVQPSEAIVYTADDLYRSE